jgi:hypothetical protein
MGWRATPRSSRPVESALGAPMIPTEPISVSWEELDRLVGVLAERVGTDYDLVLAITRGGLVPAGILAYRLDLREILVAGVEFYTTGGATHEAPIFGHFPEAELLRGKRILVVDEVWESGETMAAVVERVRAAGGRPKTAVIHYKPGRSRVLLQPDFHAALAHGWVTYPYKVGD